jgi:hypothetical protein
VQDESAVLGALSGGKLPSPELLTLRKVVKEAGMQRRKSSVSNPLLIESSARRLSKRCSKIGLPFTPPSDPEVSSSGTFTGEVGNGATISFIKTTIAQRKQRLQLQHSHLPYPMRSLHFIDEDSFVACILDYFHIVKEALEEHLLQEGKRNKDDESTSGDEAEGAGKCRGASPGAAAQFFSAMPSLPLEGVAKAPTPSNKKQKKLPLSALVQPLQPRLLSVSELRAVRLKRIQRRRQQRISNAEAAPTFGNDDHHSMHGSLRASSIKRPTLKEEAF